MKGLVRKACGLIENACAKEEERNACPKEYGRAESVKKEKMVEKKEEKSGQEAHICHDSKDRTIWERYEQMEMVGGNSCLVPQKQLKIPGG